MSPIDTGEATVMTSAEAFGRWLAEHGRTAADVVVAIHHKASGRQTVTLVELQRTAMCHGWVDTQTKRIDAERYAIRFVPRRRGSSWSPKNRRMARELLDSGQLTEAGLVTLPNDL
jgi:uncharacterized protein YdeI (YjbR/CyaY-like superfamily)